MTLGAIAEVRISKLAVQIENENIRLGQRKIMHEIVGKAMVNRCLALRAFNKQGKRKAK